MTRDDLVTLTAVINLASHAHWPPTGTYDRESRDDRYRERVAHAVEEAERTIDAIDAVLNTALEGSES